jgi:hypothetical protein
MPRGSVVDAVRYALYLLDMYYICCILLYAENRSVYYIERGACMGQ